MPFWPVQIPLPAHAWVPLLLAGLAPLGLISAFMLLSRRGRRGIATVLALRTAMVLAFGFVMLAGVATISVVRTGLRELRQRHAADVRALGDAIERSPLGSLSGAAELQMALFRGKDPSIGYVAVGTDGCRTSCIVSAPEQLEPASLKRALARAWPKNAGAESTISVGGRLYLLIAAPLHDVATPRGSTLVAAVNAEYLTEEAVRTGWVLLAISYSLLVVVGWTSWKQLRGSLATRIHAITTQLRSGMSAGAPHGMLAVDGHELRELADSVAAYIEQSLEQRKSNDERYRRLVELSPDAVFICSATGIRFANSAALALAGATGRTDLSSVPIERFLALEAEAPPHEGSPGLRLGQWTRLDGAVLHVEVAEVDDTTYGAPVRQLLVRDITNRRMREAALAHRAEHDSLTGLVNRARFEGRLAELLQRPDSDSHPGETRDVAVLYIDLDNFKPVNDEYGHAAGDAVLVAVAARLRDSTRGTDLIGRLGGDEFAVLLEVRETAEVTMVAERILRAIRQPIPADDALLRVSASVGIASTRPPASLSDKHSAMPPLSATELLRLADNAMYLVKSAGGDSFKVAEQTQSPGQVTDVSFPAVA